MGTQVTSEVESYLSEFQRAVKNNNFKSIQTIFSQMQKEPKFEETTAEQAVKTLLSRSENVKIIAPSPVNIVNFLHDGNESTLEGLKDLLLPSAKAGIDLEKLSNEEIFGGACARLRTFFDKNVRVHLFKDGGHKILRPEL